MSGGDGDEEDDVYLGENDADQGKKENDLSLKQILDLQEQIRVSKEKDDIALNDIKSLKPKMVTVKFKTLPGKDYSSFNKVKLTGKMRIAKIGDIHSGSKFDVLKGIDADNNYVSYPIGHFEGENGKILVIALLDGEYFGVTDKGFEMYVTYENGKLLRVQGLTTGKQKISFAGSKTHMRRTRHDE